MSNDDLISKLGCSLGELTEEALAMIKKKPLVEAQDVKCGDVFLFRGELYLNMLTFVDKRTTQAILTTVSARNAESATPKITGMRLFRTFTVHLVDRMDLCSIRRFDNTQDEITKEMEDRLALCRGEGH